VWYLVDKFLTHLTQLIVLKKKSYNTVLVNNQCDATLFYLVYYHSTCFGRSSRPSSGVIYKTVLAATGVCHTCGVE
jgi:hypothetical protein